jgi:hypothetical protein
MYSTNDAGFFSYSHFTGGFRSGQAEYVQVSFPFGSFEECPLTLFSLLIDPKRQCQPTSYLGQHHRQTSHIPL